MARFDVYANRHGDGFLLNVQADLMSVLNTRVVVPLLPIAHAPKPAGRLNPVLTVDGADFVMATQFMAAVPTSELTLRIASLSIASTEIVGALDMLFSGY